MDTILGIKFRDYGQIFFFTLPKGAVPSDRDETLPGAGLLPDAGMMDENLTLNPAELPDENLLAENTTAFAGDTSGNMADEGSSACGCKSGSDNCACHGACHHAAEFAGDELGRVPGDPAGLESARLDSGRISALAECGVRVGDLVVAETGQGPGLGLVVHIGGLPCGEQSEGLGPIIRATCEADRPAIEENRTLTIQAMRFCTARIRSRALEMKLVDVEVLFDKSKFIFYFTAPTRIDFRELVKDLVREYHVRIELRQIGVRHETQMIGAVGNCGMVCCCRRFLRKFAPVTIKMAKEQNLFLNPSKISGICGRLLCCLSYEQDNYDAFHRECPRLGKRYLTDKGDVKVLRANMFRNSVIVLSEAGEELEFPLEEWRTLNPRRPEGGPAPSGGRPAEGGKKSERPSDDGALDSIEADDAGADDELEPDDERGNDPRGLKRRRKRRPD